MPNRSRQSFTARRIALATFILLAAAITTPDLTRADAAAAKHVSADAFVNINANPQPLWLESYRFVELTPYQQLAGIKEAYAFADRRHYWDDDPVGQVIFEFPTPTAATAGESNVATPQGLLLTLTGGEKSWDTSYLIAGLHALPAPRLAVLLRMESLPAGQYTLKAAVQERPEVAAEVTFIREHKRNQSPPFPAEGIAVEVQPLDGVAGQIAWPITMGVPLAQGAVTDVTRLVLLEDGKPVLAQIEPVSTWHPRSFTTRDGVGDLPMIYRPSVRWAHVKFLAQYRDGKPAEYRLVHQDGPADAVSAADGKAITVETTDETITVDTGAIRFAVSRKAFAGISQAWVGGSRIVAAPEDAAAIFGPYLQDHRGIIFQSRHDPEPEVIVEEAGPLRVVIAAEGWYVHPEIGPEHGLCKFRTRLVAHAGRPDIRVQHHTIITYDTDKTRLMDVAWKLPAASPITTWTAGVDGEPAGGTLTGSAILHQFRSDKLRIITGDAAPRDARRADGYLQVTSDAGSATICLRDVWQKYPKELEVEPDGAVVHFWPEHGMRTFTSEELFGRPHLHKLRYFHQGRLLDLRFPSEAYDAILEINATERHDVDPEGMRNAALAGNAQGVAIGNDLLIRLSPPQTASATTEPDSAASLARLFQLDPHARTDPAWNVATRVEGDMAARNPEHFPHAEAAMDAFYPAYMRGVVDRADEYGMFIYANWHNNWLIDKNYPRLHRVWQNGHYQQVGIPWLLFFRGSSFELLPFARASGDNYRDVATVNYADPENPVRHHALGAMYHAKGFIPWGASGEHAKLGTTKTWAMSHAFTQGHFVNPDAYLLRYLVEGDLRSWDCYRTWMTQWSGGRVWGGASREINNTLGEALNGYRNFWDPDMLRAIGTQSEGMLSRPMTEMYAPYHHPVWHLAWFERLYELTRDPRIIQNVVDYAKVYTRFPYVNTFAYHHTGDVTYLTRNLAAVYDTVHGIYHNPGDPADGYHSAWSGLAVQFYRTLPLYLKALRDAGFDRLEPGTASLLYPSRATHPQFIASEGPALELVALDAEDQPFTFTFAAERSVFTPAWRITAPDQSVLHQQDVGKGSLTYTGENILRLPVARDGLTGLYTADFRSWEGIFFDTPISSLPVEGTVIRPQRPVLAHRRVDGWLMPIGADAELSVTFTGVFRGDVATPAYVQLFDANDKPILETTLCAGTERPAVSAQLNPATHPTPWRLRVSGYHGPQFEFTGDHRFVLFASTRDAVEKLAQHAQDIPDTR